MSCGKHEDLYGSDYGSVSTPATEKVSRPRVYRNRLEHVSAGSAFTYRGIRYVKGADKALAFRVYTSKVRQLAPDANVIVTRWGS